MSFLNDLKAPLELTCFLKDSIGFLKDLIDFLKDSIGFLNGVP